MVKAFSVRKLTLQLSLTFMTHCCPIQYIFHSPGKRQNDPSLQKTSKAFLLTKMPWPQTVKDTTWLFCLRSKTPSAADRKCILGINVYSFRQFSSAGFFFVCFNHSELCTVDLDVVQCLCFLTKWKE